MPVKKSMNFIVPMVIYPFDVMVSLGETDEQLRKALKKFDVEWSDDLSCQGLGKFLMNKQNQSVIRLKEFPIYNAHYGTLQHEIFHCVTWVMDRLGMKLKLSTSDEAYAYLIGFLTTEIYKKIHT